MCPAVESTALHAASWSGTTFSRYAKALRPAFFIVSLFPPTCIMFDLINTFAQYFYPIASAVSTSPAIGASSPATSTNGATMQQQEQETGLFGLDLVSPEVAAQLPPGYRFRALRRSDYNSGFLDCLRVLTTVGEITEEDFQKQYDAMDEQEGYYIMVIEDTARKEHAVVATGALMVERKFIHSLGRVGHIEDIAVAKDQQGKKLGLRMIQALDYVAKNVGCYKTILDCSEANEGFYIKCGFRRAGLEMAHYHNKG